ncbi:MAG: glycosyltransferase family 4 protein [DPANN group archaeon]|nr:glycosyltransferase family 4 protein [DPANN group archaeon]
MFGWEFPPFSSGGLGTACKGLTDGLSQKGVKVTFVIPKASGGTSSVSSSGAPGIQLIGADQVGDMKVIEVDSVLRGYVNAEQYHEHMMTVLNRQGHPATSLYGKDLHQEVLRYAEIAKRIALLEDFDVIHAHDWMTYQAGINAKEASGKPLVVHVHATEFDRSGDNPNQAVYALEKMGMERADRIIAVSSYTKGIITDRYGIPPDKVAVVHNAVAHNHNQEHRPPASINDGMKTVLFLGRITMQKGPDYFLYAAKRVLDFFPHVRFVVAGSGDMERFMIDKAASLGIADRVLFTGFLSAEQTEQAYRMADLYVLPSVSEPFGITPLESLTNGTPVIISRQSGVSEVLKNCLKVDFWDIDDMASKMLSVLKYPALENQLVDDGRQEVSRMSWEDSAEKCLSIYQQVRGFP